MDLIKLIKDKRPNLKDNSLRSYIITLRKLNDDKNIENLNFLKNHKEIMEKIDKFKLPTQRNKLTAILVVLSAFQKKEFDEVEMKYRQELEERNKQYNDFLGSHQKTEKQQENWTSIAELKKIMKNYKKNATNTIKGFQPYLVSALYLLQPPKRLDFSNMKIITTRKEDDKKNNFLLNMGRNKKYFIFNQYKTDKQNGSKEVLIPKDINSILNKWLQINKTDDFLLNSKGGPMTSNGLGKYITKIFKPTGKNITLNLLRNIFVTENIDLEAVNKAKKIAEQMDHSESTQKTVYLKKD
tara:strand:- start:172 stop:1062 length:891 start_codon:yes stop_codon:yes gene_type:complete